MADSDRTMWQKLLQGVMGSTAMSNSVQCAANVDQRIITFSLPATAANTNVADCGVVKFDRQVKVLSVALCPGASTLQDTTNYGLINVSQDNGGGGSASLIAQCNTHNSAQGSLNTNIWETLTVTAANAIINSGNCMTVGLTAVTGTLAAVGKLQFSVVVQEI